MVYYRTSHYNIGTSKYNPLECSYSIVYPGKIQVQHSAS